MDFKIIKEIYEHDSVKYSLGTGPEGQNLLIREFASLSEDDFKFLTDKASDFLGFNHPSISTIIEIQEKKDKVYLIEDIKYDCNLQEYLGKNSHLTTRAANWIRDNLLNALEHAHAVGIIHGQIRPELCWINPGSKSLILSGFSIFKGTPVEFIAAPEHYTEAKLGVPSDIFNLGAMFYYIITGKKLPNIQDVKQGTKNIMEPRNQVGLEADWNRFIMRAIELKRAKRFDEIKAIKSFFGNKIQGTPQQEQRRVSPESITRKKNDEK